MDGSVKTKQRTLLQGGPGTGAIGYMPGLDGLRALAVFAVIAYHLGVTWAPGGLLGVNLFFVLSGYLITDILLTQREASGSIGLKNFWLRRIRRLLPALFVMLTAVMLWVVLFAPERLAALKQEAMAAVFYISNWYLIFHEVSYFESFGPPSPLGHLWSLAIEEQFYLFWPLLLGLGFRRLKRRKWMIAGTIAIALISAAAMALIYIPGHDPSRVYYGTDTRAFALLFGAVLAMVWPGRKLSGDLSGTGRLALDAAGFIGLLIVLWMIFKTNQYQPFLYQSGLVLFSAAATCLVAVLAHPASRLAKVFAWRPLRLLGKWSYGIYLWHYPVILLSTPPVNTGGPDLLRSFWQIAISVILAALSYHLIEEPIRYGRLKPLILSARVSVSMLLIFGIMFVAANEGVQVLAKDLTKEPPAGGHIQVIGEQTGIPQEQAPPFEPQEPGTPSTEGSSPDSPPSEEPSPGGPPTEKPGAEGPVAGRPSSEAPPAAAEVAGSAGKTEGGIEELISGDRVTVIGDSLLIDMIPVLQERLPGIVVDAKKGRQMYDAPEVVSKLRKNGKFGDTIILGLGTNGAFTEKQLKATLDCLEGVREIVLINSRVPKPWESVVNDTLAKVVGDYPNARLIDWYGISSGHDEYFYQDGVHLNPAGAKAYCKMITEALSADQNAAHL